VALRPDGLDAEQLARHREPGHPVAAILEQGRGPQAAAAHGIQAGEAIADAARRISPAPAQRAAPGRIVRMENENRLKLKPDLKL